MFWASPLNRGNIPEGVPDIFNQGRCKFRKPFEYLPLRIWKGGDYILQIIFKHINSPKKRQQRAHKKKGLETL